MEKLLKAILTAHEVETPRTHDLRRLIQIAIPFVPELVELVDASDSLTVHGVETRYPGDYIEVEMDEMVKIIEIAEQLGKTISVELCKLDSD